MWFNICFSFSQQPDVQISLCIFSVTQLGPQSQLLNLSCASCWDVYTWIARNTMKKWNKLIQQQISISRSGWLLSLNLQTVRDQSETSVFLNLILHPILQIAKRFKLFTDIRTSSFTELIQGHSGNLTKWWSHLFSGVFFILTVSISHLNSTLRCTGNFCLKKIHVVMLFWHQKLLFI